jgi:hypothetical protein
MSSLSSSDHNVVSDGPLLQPLTGEQARQLAPRAEKYIEPRPVYVWQEHGPLSGPASDRRKD